MEHKRLQDVLPKLGQIMAKDFRDFSNEWEEVLKVYTEVFNPPPQEVSIFYKVEMNCGKVDKHSVSEHNKHYGT
jgi:hypothetical protein